MVGLLPENLSYHASLAKLCPQACNGGRTHTMIRGLADSAGQHRPAGPLRLAVLLRRSTAKPKSAGESRCSAIRSHGVAGEAGQRTFKISNLAAGRTLLANGGPQSTEQLCTCATLQDMSRPPSPHPFPEPLIELVAQRFRVLGEPMRIGCSPAPGQRRHGRRVAGGGRRQPAEHLKAPGDPARGRHGQPHQRRQPRALLDQLSVGVRALGARVRRGAPASGT